MGGTELSPGMDVDEFNEYIFTHLAGYPMLWILGEKPVAMVNATLSQNGVWIGWDTFPWATPRQLYENIVNFVNVMRKDLNMLFMTPNARLMDALARHGIVRRAGTFYGIYEETEDSDGRACLYQSRDK